jgi:hypothetical protein
LLFKACSVLMVIVSLLMTVAVTRAAASNGVNTI